MNLKIRKIDNTEWIENLFQSNDKIYFVDSKPNGSTNTLCQISITSFLENLKIKQDLDRSFLAHPNPMFSSLELSSSTDIEIVEVYPNYIQNLVFTENKTYISFIVAGQILTSDILDLETHLEIQIIKKLKSGILVKKNAKTFLTDENFKKIKEISFDIVSIVEFESNFIIQTSDEKIFLTDLEFKFINSIKEDGDFKRIFYLNKNNVLISYKKNETTYMYNFQSNTMTEFDKSFINRGIMVGDNLFVSKVISEFDKSGKLKIYS